MHSRTARNSEVDAYTYITSELHNLGWNVKNPGRIIDGEVYKQNEVLSNEELKKGLNRDMPEAVVKLNSKNEFWVIEAKKDKKDIGIAVDEAINQYAKKINANTQAKCVIATGVAGNDIDGYIVVTKCLKGNNRVDVLFNGKQKDTLLSKRQASFILESKIPDWREFPDFDEEKYISSAERLNEILHDAGINKNRRARFIAGLILSLSLDGGEIGRHENTKVLVDNINTLIKEKLSEVGKHDFYDYIKLEVPPSKENHAKYRNAIIYTLNELQTLDIKNAMSSGNDVLGKFYEKFLKYGNGAKEIGIVLTPRHLTEFGVEVLNVKYNDFVFDPTCGTGGFLVAAFDYVKKSGNDQQVDKFKYFNIFGVDQDDDVIALALVNMIFRGDGRNNMSEGNCFQKDIVRTQIGKDESGAYVKRLGRESPDPIITKVLMNPPFALKKGEEKEYKFIDYALSQMQDNGLLFAIIPSPIMFKSQQTKERRKEMLRKNTLKAVIKLPEDLFYPVGVHTSAVIIEKGVAHDFSKDVFWGKLDDGNVKKKGVMKKKYDGNIDIIKSAVKDFLNGSITLNRNLGKVYSLLPILNDRDLECAPEYYLQEDAPSEEAIIEEMKNCFSRIVNFLINNPYLPSIRIDVADLDINDEDNLDSLFTIENAKSKNIEEYGTGKMPFVTSTNMNNGVEMFIDEDEESCIYRSPCITVSSFGQAHVQLTPFVARSHGAVIVLKPKRIMSISQLLYYAAQINLHKRRFSYGRWVTKKRLLKLDIKNINHYTIPSLVDIERPIKESMKNIIRIFEK